MDTNGERGPARAIHILVSDALEALLPLVDEWADSAKRHRIGNGLRAFAEGYERGVESMASEVKDQLVERITRLRE